MDDTLYPHSIQKYKDYINKDRARKSREVMKETMRRINRRTSRKVMKDVLKKMDSPIRYSRPQPKKRKRPSVEEQIAEDEQVQHGDKFDAEAETSDFVLVNELGREGHIELVPEVCSVFSIS